MEEFKLNDEVIANIAKLIQIAILTGTDIVDNLRMIRLANLGDGEMGLHESFRENLDNNIEDMLKAINSHDENLEEETS